MAPGGRGAGRAGTRGGGGWVRRRRRLRRLLDGLGQGGDPAAPGVCLPTGPAANSRATGAAGGRRQLGRVAGPLVRDQTNAAAGPMRETVSVSAAGGILAPSIVVPPRVRPATPPARTAGGCAARRRRKRAGPCGSSRLGDLTGPLGQSGQKLSGQQMLHVDAGPVAALRSPDRDQHRHGQSLPGSRAPRSSSERRTALAWPGRPGQGRAGQAARPRCWLGSGSDRPPRAPAGGPDAVGAAPVRRPRPAPRGPPRRADPIEDEPAHELDPGHSAGWYAGARRRYGRSDRCRNGAPSRAASPGRYRGGGPARRSRNRAAPPACRPPQARAASAFRTSARLRVSRMISSWRPGHTILRGSAGTGCHPGHREMPAGRRVATLGALTPKKRAPCRPYARRSCCSPRPAPARQPGACGRPGAGWLRAPAVRPG